MDIRMGSKDGPEPIIGGVLEQMNMVVKSLYGQAVETLTSDPGQLDHIEQEVHGTCAKLADHIVATIIAQSSQRPEMQSNKTNH